MLLLCQLADKLNAMLQRKQFAIDKGVKYYFVFEHIDNFLTEYKFKKKQAWKHGCNIICNNLTAQEVFREIFFLKCLSVRDNLS